MDLKQAKACFTADDWGMSPGINFAILEMARKGIIKRVSILAGSPFVKHGLDELLKILHLQFGLHFNLTLFPPLFEEQQDGFSPFMDPANFHYKPLYKLLLIWFLPIHRKTKLPAAADAFKGQLEKLRTLKVPVTYFDGHQQVHLLPGILEAVQPELMKYGITQTRLPLSFRLFFSRRFFTALLALRARGVVKRLGLRYLPFWHPSLRALSSLRRVKRKVSRCSSELEIVVHPSTDNDLESYGIRDRYRKGRLLEYFALKQLSDSSSSGV